MRNRWIPLVVVLLPGCLSPATTLQQDAPEARPLAMVDPALPGALDVARLVYDLGMMTVTEPRTQAAPFPSHLIGNVHYPSQGGPYPVVLFMHGRHATCGLTPSGLETLGPVVCPPTPATYPVDSYTGYDYLGKQLASHGYVVISVSANNINDLDMFYGDAGATSRAQLVLRTLDDFQRFNKTQGPQPIGDKLVGKLDFSRVGLMGHSRGGEGVTRAITYNRDRTDGTPHHIKAVFALAPTDFARWSAPDVAFATLLPYCDGDVSNLQGGWMFDDARTVKERVPSPKIQILALGSNHNFYNTVWTGNDAGRYSTDAHCSALPERQKGRFVFLGEEDQRRHGLVYMSAFFRAYVGDELELRPLFEGAVDPPASACPAKDPDCRGLLHVSYQAPTTRRLILDDLGSDASLSKNDLGGDNRFQGFTNKTVCAAAACPAKPNYAAATQLVLGWDQPGANASFRFPAQDVRGFDALTFRIGVAGGDPRNEPDTPQALTLEVLDTAGGRASIDVGAHSAALFEPPGRPAQKTTLNMVRIPTDAFDEIDRSSVTEVRLVFDQTPDGLVNLVDLQWQSFGHP